MSPKSNDLPLQNSVTGEVAPDGGSLCSGGEWTTPLKHFQVFRPVEHILRFLAPQAGGSEPTGGYRPRQPNATPRKTVYAVAGPLARPIARRGTA